MMMFLYPRLSGLNIILLLVLYKKIALGDMIQIFETTFQIDTNDIVNATMPFISLLKHT